jgi:hypothetical protein
MKRSEMVKIIARELRAQGSGHTDINPDLVLSVIEAFGMLPPPTGIEYGVTKTLCYVGYDYLEMEDDVEQSLWEPEDED